MFTDAAVPARRIAERCEVDVLARRRVIDDREVTVTRLSEQAECGELAPDGRIDALHHQRVRVLGYLSFRQRVGLEVGERDGLVAVGLNRLC